MKKIIVLGANGQAGSRLVSEAVARGHQVTAVAKQAGQYPEGVKFEAVDVLEVAALAAVLKGNDVVISALGPKHGQESDLVALTKAIIEASKQADIRLISVGGAGSLEVAPGLMLMDTEGFHSDWKPIAQAHAQALALLKAEATLDWLSVSPAGMFAPGEKTGQYRLGFDSFMTDASGNSSISMEDYAVAVLDEVEKSEHHRKRISLIGA